MIQFITRAWRRLSAIFRGKIEGPVADELLCSYKSVLPIQQSDEKLKWFTVAHADELIDRGVRERKYSTREGPLMLPSVEPAIQMRAAQAERMLSEMRSKIARGEPLLP